MPLAAFLLLLRSFGLPNGQAGHGEADCPVQFYQGKTFYSRCILVFSCQVSYIQAESLWLKKMVWRPCFKACNKHTESHIIFLGIKIPICTNLGYVCSYCVFPYTKHLKKVKKRTLPLSGQRLFILQDCFCLLKIETNCFLLYLTVY